MGDPLAQVNCARRSDSNLPVVLRTGCLVLVETSCKAQAVVVGVLTHLADYNDCRTCTCRGDWMAWLVLAADRPCP